MKIRMLRDWRHYKAGKILTDAPDGYSNVLIKRGIAEEVNGEPAEEPKPAPKRTTKRKAKRGSKS